MAAKFQFLPLHLQTSLLLLFLFSNLLSASQSTPQNIQVYFPIPTPPPPPPPLSQTTPPPETTISTASRSSNKPIAKAVVITASCTLVLSGLLFLLLLKLKLRSKKETTNLYADSRINYSNDDLGMQKNDEFMSFGAIKKVIVDDDHEQGLDVIYLKMVHDNGGRKSKFDCPIQEIHFIREKSSGSRIWRLEDHNSDSVQVIDVIEDVRNQETMESQLLLQSPPLPPPNAAVPPPPPPVLEKKSSAPLPPILPKSGGLTLLSQRPPPLPKGNMSLSNDNKVKLKPLHWDKVNANVEHDMVWHKLRNGSFRVDDDQMKSLFGTIATDKPSPSQESTTSPGKGGQSMIFLLDTRKSQNIAIVLKSIAISRHKIIECLQQGHGLDIDTLEKLNRITPSKEEATIILEFEGDITKLADAESFLYHILRSVPSAFTRFSIMLFKLNYYSEVSDLNNSLRTLEAACKELKTRGLFVKLLEAVLKAGNRMNAGTSRGNAQAFNLNSLLKLSDVKSSDGTTTLLHFVVEEVVRLEGKRCNINRSTGGSSGAAFTESYYIKLGLPVVGGVSSEFCNVKKAAGIEYDAFSKTCSGLRNHLAEIKKSMEECEGDGGFVREMGRFLEEAEMEIETLREEEERVMGVVKMTNEYYQAGGSKEFELFVIIRAFLEMVDKACVDIAVKLQKRRTGGGSPEAGKRAEVKFPALPANFRIGTSSGSSSDSD
ncbi:unnamed protein product [Lactuca virosa]|uniref:Formin-like protein n=1 Tax=Lactuca virosa TaxID=75947 RepID=A0AAU9MDP0_9ASTR|nr:unnamed protein product [Lactuca virosa]